MKTSCAHCGNELDRPPCRIKANPRQFCDHACHTAYQQRRRVEVACVICGKTKSVAPSHASASPVCSPDCERERISRMRIDYFGSAENRTATCARCGKGFARKPSQLAKYGESFCSRACHAAHKQGQPSPNLRTGEWLPCEGCGQDVWRTPATRQAHVFCSIRCQRKVLPHPHLNIPGPRGPQNVNWKGGGAYGSGFTEMVKRQIRKRDGNACRVCGLQWKPKSGNLVVHHVDEQKFDHDDSNLITLCRPCHQKVHSRKIRFSA